MPHTGAFRSLVPLRIQRTLLPTTFAVMCAVLAAAPLNAEFLSSPGDFSSAATTLTFNNMYHSQLASQYVATQDVYVSITNGAAIALSNLDPTYFSNVPGHDYPNGMAVTVNNGNGRINEIDFYTDQYHSEPAHQESAYVAEVGFWLSTGPESSWTVSAYHDDQLLGTTDVTMPENNMAVFAGFQFEQGISSIRITSHVPSGYIDILDDLTISKSIAPQPVPEPASFALLLSGLSGLGMYLWRRQPRATGLIA